VILVTTGLDCLYYNKLVFTPLSFLQLNLSGIALFYGTAPWHYYFTQAIPILCTSALPFVLHGIWTTIRRSRAERVTTLPNMLSLIIWTIGIYSTTGHKEWRFIHPILPLLHVFAVKSLVDLFDSAKKASKGESKNYGRLMGLNMPIRRSHLAVLLSTVPVSLYCVLLYCSGPISVMSYLRSIPPSEQAQSVGILMPCHSTPGHAYLHQDGLENTFWSLGCEPPLG
jgi:GPI mannosyltransferase 3